MTSVKKASEFLKVPEKSLKRWIEVGPERQKGCGRKPLDIKMEMKVKNWVLNNLKVTCLTLTS